MVATRSGGPNRGRRTRRQLNARINVTPLVDVMLVLLIVFMIATPLLKPGVPIELPKTDAAPLPPKEDSITITVDVEGKIYLQETEITLEELTPKLIALAENGYDQRINIQGDTKVNYGPVMEVMASINAAGFTTIGLVTDSKKK